MAYGVEELLTPKEVAKLFKVHRRTLLRWAEIGRFPHPIKIEGLLRWRANEIWAHQQAAIKDSALTSMPGKKLRVTGSDTA